MTANPATTVIPRRPASVVIALALLVFLGLSAAAGGVELTFGI